MNGNLAEEFQKVREAIMREPVLPQPMNGGRLDLIAIMRSANAAYNETQPKGAAIDTRKFNPDSLKAQGIDPKAFTEAMAHIYAREVLSQYDNQGPYQEVLLGRCNKSLDISHEYALGHFLPEDVKDALHKKLEKNGFVCAYPRAQQPS